MKRTISNSDDVIDSRDVIERIEELRADRPDMPDKPEAKDYPTDGSWAEAEEEELNALIALESEAEGYAADWKYGEALIRDSHFEDYARELAEDIGALKDDAQWPATCIDWEEAARQLQQDYTSVEFDGVTYWIR